MTQGRKVGMGRFHKTQTHCLYVVMSVVVGTACHSGTAFRLRARCVPNTFTHRVACRAPSRRLTLDARHQLVSPRTMQMSSGLNQDVNGAALVRRLGLEDYPNANLKVRYAYMCR